MACTQKPLFEAHDTGELLPVISASRRTDLVSCYPDYLIDKLQAYPPDRVHTLVLWTKNPYKMLSYEPLCTCLQQYRQLYVHLTITGLGGTFLEPNIPPWREVVAMVPQVLNKIGGPRRLVWRFDPIIRVEYNGRETENFSLFEDMARALNPCGIAVCRTSWVEPYRKVVRRMDKKAVRLVPFSPEERREQAARLEKVAAAVNMQMQYCSVEGFSRSRCIDGKFFAGLHPDGAVCSARGARGQRKLCGCTESIDIGWYSLKCTNGCLYCYAEPVED